MELTTVKIDKPEAINFILGQAHFIKTVEDIHEALVGAVPGIKFGVAFNEASGKCLVRVSGTEEAMIALARQNALNLAAGHCFILFLGGGISPSTCSIPSRTSRKCATSSAPRPTPPK